MSKSVSDQDVEDMLSSVRRLVSNELPPHRRISQPPEADKLVLTEAHRVTPGNAGQNSRDVDRGTRLEDRIAELEEAVSKAPDDWEPDGSEDQAQNQPDRMVYTPPPASSRRTSRRISRITLIETPAADDAAPEDESGSAEHLSPPEIEAVARATVQDTVSRSDAFEAALNKAVETSLRETTRQPEPSVSPEPVQARETPSEPPVATVSTPEPAAAGETTARAKPEPAPADEPEPAPNPSPPVLAAPAPAAFDEDALRTLVNKLLREELQGEIGERITRNVRKLVRQEIHRAITVQDAE